MVMFEKYWKQFTKTSRQSTGFTVFAFTWAMAGLIHQLSFSDWRWHDPEGIVLSGAILLVLYKPSSWQRFAVFLFVDWVSVALNFPNHPNHIVFSWIVNGTMLAALVMVAGKSKGISETDFTSRWYATFAPWLRIELCMLYFFTVFHKLNASYFDLDCSCAVRMHVEINDRFSLIPQSRLAQQITIYGTLIVEAAIPLLLIFRRTRAAGVIVGMVFHAVLALHSHPGIFSFSATMTALFITFLPLSAVEGLKPRNEIHKAWRWGLFVLGAILLLWILRKLLPEDLRLEEALAKNWKAGFIVYYLYLAIGLALFIRSLRAGHIETQTEEGSWRTHPVLVCFALLLFANGFGPYIGLRTQSSFSMFSNLHTENGMSNHFIVPSGIQLTNWQYDLVEIVDSNDAKLNLTRDNRQLVVYLDLRRVRTNAGSNFWVTFRRHGSTETFDMKKPETHDVLPAFGFLAKRYFFFRPVDREPMKVKCKH